jgi:dolichol-phosphate mannosyltransferase
MADVLAHAERAGHNEQTLVILPTFNEAGNIDRIARELLAISGVELLIVDDDSPDGTGLIADGLKRTFDGRISVLHRSAKQGLASAYIDGFRQALGRNPDYVVQMDADFSHNPADVPRLIRAMRDADVAIGSRYVKGGGAVHWSLLRRMVSRCGSAYARTILGLPVRDATSGFKCFRASALRCLDLTSVRARGFGFMVEVNWHCYQRKLRLIEVPICFEDRKRGESKMTFGIFVEAALLVWRLKLQGILPT